MRPRRRVDLVLIVLGCLLLAVPPASAAVSERQPTRPERLWKEFPLGERLQPAQTRTVRPARVVNRSPAARSEAGTKSSSALRVPLTILLIVLASVSILSIVGGALLRRARALRNSYYARKEAPDPDWPAEEEESAVLRQELRRVMRGMGGSATRASAARGGQDPVAGADSARILEAAEQAADQIRSKAERAAQEVARQAEVEAEKIRAAAQAYAAEVRSDADAAASGERGRRAAPQKQVQKSQAAPVKAGRAARRESSR